MAYRTIKEALAEDKKGFHIGQRLILPFRCQLIKLIFDNEIHTEMVGNPDIKLHQDPRNTSIYVTSRGRLSNFIGRYKYIKLIVCEWDDDLCDVTTHQKLICELHDNHEVDIAVPSEDTLFVE